MEDYIKNLYIKDSKMRGTYKEPPIQEITPTGDLQPTKKEKKKKEEKEIDDYDLLSDIIDDIIKDKPKPARVRKMIRRYLEITDEAEDN